MGSKQITILWAISLGIIAIATIVLSVANIVGAELPDIVKWLFGLADLIALPVLVFTTVKKFHDR